MDFTSIFWISYYLTIKSLCDWLLEKVLMGCRSVFWKLLFLTIKSVLTAFGKNDFKFIQKTKMLQVFVGYKSVFL